MKTITSLLAICAIAAPASAQALNESFDYSTTAVFPPTGWMTTNNNAGAYVGFDEPAITPCSVGTLTADCAGHDDFGSATTNDNSLHAPTMDLTGYGSAELNFDSDLGWGAFTTIGGAGNGTSDVEVSTDGGATWTSVWQETQGTTGYYPGQNADLSAYGGNAAVDMRFDYFGDYAHAWAIDNVVVDNAVAPGPALAVSGTCPGALTADASNMTAGGPVVFAWGLSGSLTLAGGPCAGLSLPVASTRHLATVAADASGNASITGNAPASACGSVILLAVDGASCTAANAVGI